jgi:hypothetical protein
MYAMTALASVERALIQQVDLWYGAVTIAGSGEARQGAYIITTVTKLSSFICWRCSKS